MKSNVIAVFGNHLSSRQNYAAYQCNMISGQPHDIIASNRIRYPAPGLRYGYQRRLCYSSNDNSGFINITESKRVDDLHDRGEFRIADSC
jgi:hypothetical protein